jgi:hypothetical protein
VPAPGQFTIGRVLLATVAAGVALAAIGPRIRAWPAGAQLMLLGIWGLALPLLLGVPAFLLWRTARTYQRSGEAVHRVRTSRRTWFQYLMAGFFVVNAGAQFVIADWMCSDPRTTEVPFGAGMLIAQTVGMLFLAEVFWLSAPLAIELRSEGILASRFQLIGWNEIERAWTRESPPTLFVVSRHTTHAFAVPAAEIPAVEDVLARYAKGTSGDRRPEGLGEDSR